MENVIGLITCNYSAKAPGFMGDERPLASMPFMGRYRLVDFSLSNMVNAKIRTIGMVMPYNYRSLIDHVGSGKDWNLDRKNGGLFILPGSAFGTSRTGSRFLLRDLAHNKPFFLRSTAEYVVLSTANIVLNLDLTKFIADHAASGADVTVLAQTAPQANEDVVRLNLDGTRVTGIHHGVASGEKAFLDLFVVSRQLLLDMLDWYATTDYLDLFEAMGDDYGRVNVQIKDFEGYAAPVFDKATYFGTNMDMLNPEITDSVVPGGRFIKTKAHDTPPAKHEVGSKVKNSLISAGCRIFGDVEGSVLGRNVIVEAGATVKNAVIFQDCVIKSGATVEYAIVDRNNIVPAGIELRGTAEDILVQEKGQI